MAAFFMFFDGLNKIKHWYNYLRNPKIEVLSNLLKQIVDIKKIEQATVYQAKNKLAILEITPFNFMLKTEEEKNAIIIGFQKFLNGLDFPIQIHITSTPIQLSEHLRYTDNKIKEKIKSIKDEKKAELLQNLINSYCEFVKKTIKENKIQNRNFYIIIQEKDYLDVQVKVCSEKLASLGLKVKQLQDS